MQRIRGELGHSRASDPVTSDPAASDPVAAHPRMLLTPAVLSAAMLSSQPRRRAHDPRGSLCALLALLLLAPLGSPVSASPVTAILRELRCVCLTPTRAVHPRMITNLQVIAAGPQCPRAEIIATLKNRKDPVCLDPQAPQIKKVIKMILDSSKKHKSKVQLLGKAPTPEPVSVKVQ